MMTSVLFSATARSGFDCKETIEQQTPQQEKTGLYTWQFGVFRLKVMYGSRQWVLGVLQKLCLILRGERFCFCFELRLSGLIEFWRRGCPGWNWYPHLRKELFLPGRRANAQQTCRSVALVLKLVRRIGRNMNGLADTCNRLYSSKGSLDLAFENDERVLKIVPVRRWAAARWDMHIDKAEASSCVFPCQKDRVSVSYQSDVR
jgi:hypothetical protein